MRASGNECAPLVATGARSVRVPACVRVCCAYVCDCVCSVLRVRVCVRARDLWVKVVLLRCENLFLQAKVVGTVGGQGWGGAMCLQVCWSKLFYFIAKTCFYKPVTG